MHQVVFPTVLLGPPRMAGEHRRYGNDGHALASLRPDSSGGLALTRPDLAGLGGAEAFPRRR